MVKAAGDSMPKRARDRSRLPQGVYPARVGSLAHDGRGVANGGGECSLFGSVCDSATDPVAENMLWVALADRQSGSLLL